MRWKIPLTLLCMALPTFTVSSGTYSPISTRRLALSPSPIIQILPDQKVYELLFSRLAELDHQAELLEAAGKHGVSFRSYLAGRLGLDHFQSQRLKYIASNSLLEAANLDQRATEIIRRFRSKFQKGRYRSSDGFPKPPRELASLQLQRDAVFLRGRDQLMVDFGEIDFEIFHARVKMLFEPYYRK